MLNRVRGIRQKLPPGVVLGTPVGAQRGSTQHAAAIPIATLINSVLQSGVIPLPGNPAPSYNNRGAWSAANSYAVNDYVTYQGSTYLCLSPVAPTAVSDTWNASFNANVTVSNGGLDAEGETSGQWETTQSMVSHSTGKWVFEGVIVAAGDPNPSADGWQIGIGPATTTPHARAGTDANISFGADLVANSDFDFWINNTKSPASSNYTPAHWAIGDTITFAVDLTNKKIWIRDATYDNAHSADRWQGGSAGPGSFTDDPATPATGFDISAMLSGSPAIFPTASLFFGGSKAKILLQTTAATLTRPISSGMNAAGYLPWVTVSSTAPLLDDVHWLAQGVSGNQALTSGVIPVANGANSITNSDLSDDLGTTYGLVYNLSGQALTSSYSIASFGGGGQVKVVPPNNSSGSVLMIAGLGTTSAAGTLSVVHVGQGSLASPAALPAGTIIYAFNAVAWNGSAFIANRARAFLKNTNLWSGSNEDMGFYVQCTPVGSLTSSIELQIQGGMQVYNAGVAPTGGAKGSGTVNAATAFYTAGVLNGTQGFTVATLPAAPGTGARAYVTDATAPTFLGTLTGGGTVTCPVFYNGSTWVAG